MVALRRILLGLAVLPAGACAVSALWPSVSPEASLSQAMAAPGAPSVRAVEISAGTTRFVRAGMFQMPVLHPRELAAGPLSGGPADLLQASLEIVPEGGFETGSMPDDVEIPGDPVRDDVKSGVTQWPAIDRSRKGDQDILGLRPSVRRDPDAPRSLLPPEPLFPQKGAPPLARLSRRLAPPPPGSPLATFHRTRIDAGLAAVIAGRLRPPAADPGEDDTEAVASGAVPLDHSLAPAGGTSPAASRPDLAGLDTRTTDGEAERPMELTALAPEPVITLANVQPATPEDEAAAMDMPALGPDEGLTTEQKNRLIAGLPGLDDGVARPLTLPPVAYTRAQICLATAVYFEARSESEEGQIAVAQVVINRVRSPFYPKNVCDVVYQGASTRRWGGCQFSFACTHISQRVTEDAPWRQAMSIAQRVMDAEAWLPEVGNATHYHATYVHPRWVRDMREMDRIGRHIFYRVKWWGMAASAA